MRPTTRADSSPSKELAILVHMDFGEADSEENLREFSELALSAGAQVVSVVAGARRAPSAKYFVGSGKAQDIALEVQTHQANLVLFNHALSPAQERNLERLLKCRVLDRTGLILDIFAQRARTFEGKLQVELAQLQHLSTRLIRGWTHLERQKGGIGLRGPGETQLETDRRLIRHRIKTIHKRLEKVRLQRAQGRRARQKKALPTISLVGYTNAGKSTLFNVLTGGNVYVADKLFATLDPTLKRVILPDAGPMIFADTVGFIRHLPHDLVDAFRATLEETRDASLLIHVVDASDAERSVRKEQVMEVLTQVGAEKVPQLQVYNKIDLLDASPRIDRDAEGRPWRVWLSALTGEGLALFKQALAELIWENAVCCHLILEPTQAALRAALYELGGVLSEENDTQGRWILNVRLSKRDYERLLGKLS